MRPSLCAKGKSVFLTHIHYVPCSHEIGIVCRRRPATMLPPVESTPINWTPSLLREFLVHYFHWHCLKEC